MALAHNPSIVTSGLVLCLDAANPRSYPGSGTVWYDLSGNSRNATFNNTIVYNNQNLGSLVFDDGNERIDVTTGLNSLGTSDFTVETLVKSTNVVYPRSRHPFKLFHTVHSSATPGWSVGHTASSNSIEVRCADGTNLSVITISHETIAESTFYYRTFTVSRSSGLLTRCYINSNYVGQANATAVTGSIFNATGDGGGTGAVFGDVYGWRYIGSVNFIKIYNKVLSDAEIRQNFNAARGRYGL